jgi:hypothetical protein
MTDFKVRWIDHRREPQNQPDPRYPNGVDLDITNGTGPNCATPLPYPAKRCGLYVVECKACGANALVTTAGRPDDPRSLRISCRPRLH